MIDTAGVIRWVNPAAMELLGDVRGRQFTSVVAPEETRRAREVFMRKIVGAVSAAETEGVLLTADGARVTLELCAVPLRNGDRIVGVFGQLVGELEEPARAPHPDLTPRQAEVLRLLGQGRSTRQIADELHLTTETVRNHVRNLLRTMGVHSRIEAVAAAGSGVWSYVIGSDSAAEGAERGRRSRVPAAATNTHGTAYRVVHCPTDAGIAPARIAPAAAPASISTGASTVNALRAPTPVRSASGSAGSG